ncbi:mitochondrial uncoupling protein 3-like [Mercenaria mercenaria]|uniref:mitochondrial uncoupling protein 3-like n=1 Tax=Mercenaria mercenaria TaxID=6596 RepID=UPI00234E6C97|nr:mitochondrial uncoupling protein 3-like [Mercenaria mercenaria]
MSTSGASSVPSAQPVMITTSEILSVPPIQPTLGVKLVSAGLGGCIAELITLPLDTAKVRLQVRNVKCESWAKSMRLLVNGDFVSLKSLPTKAPGMVRTMNMIINYEGPKALYSGLVPGLQRQMCFASIRIGCYDDMKSRYQSLFGNDADSSPSVFIRILSGLTTGALCVTVAQPTDVVKIRMQASGAIGHHAYTKVFKAYSQIARTEGIRGLWKGYIPNVARNSIMNVSELVTYDMIKEEVLRYKLFEDNLKCHIACGFGSGFVATIIASPIDVVKTRYMSSFVGQYTGVIDCLVQMIKENGLRSLYKGVVPSFMRIGSWNIVMFVCYEEIKKLLHQENHETYQSVQEKIAAQEE